MVQVHFNVCMCACAVVLGGNKSAIVGDGPLQFVVCVCVCTYVCTGGLVACD